VSLVIKCAVAGASSGSFGSGFSASAASFGGSSGGSFGGDGEVTRGETQVIDLATGGAPSNVVYKPVYKEGPVQISNHFYIHESPEDALTPEERQKEIEARRHKHYKIIFIKAPSEGSAFAAGSTAFGVQVDSNFSEFNPKFLKLQIHSQNEEKTIIYVLSNKPEGISEDGEIPTPPEPITSKPEVFFVKYDSQAQADQAIATVQREKIEENS
jgi:hypothetical protein